MKIIQKIRNPFEQLSPSKKKVASYFLNHYSTLYLDTVVGLSEKIGVSDTLAETPPAGVSDVISLFQAHAKSITENLQSTIADPENQAAISAAVVLLASAQKIYFIGFYNKAALAKSEALFLLYRGYEAEAIYPDLGDYIDHLLWAKEGGVAIHCHSDAGDSSLCPDEDVLCHAVSRLLLTTLTDLHPGKTLPYNEALREGVFTRFNPYGALETSSNRLDRI